ncbi:hypothetical protein M885DRAFT_623043 [Pelagophyceae sp. CCMP2097]|nr:hypothetical protein M885DRAFT_623043 [Pelagophyceae sp. CCMP2097]
MAAMAPSEERNAAAWSWYEQMGSPQTVLAPMVECVISFLRRHSALAFRLQTRKYGAQLCVTPMVNARSFITSDHYRAKVMEDISSCPEADRPLVVQFAGHDPELLLKAARYVEDTVDAVDLNLGCPQGIAKKGNYGAFLLEDCDLVVDILTKLSANLKCKVTAKIRLFPDMERTLELVDRICESGVSMLTVHGRTKEMKQQFTGKCDWQGIASVVERVRGRIPVVANGGIETFEDVERCLMATKAQGVMISEASLANPAVFRPEPAPSKYAMALEYLDFAKRFPPPAISSVRGHLFKMAHEFIQTGTPQARHVRQLLVDGQKMDDFYDAVNLLFTTGQGRIPVSWYNRHRYTDPTEVAFADEADAMDDDAPLGGLFDDE